MRKGVQTILQPCLSAWSVVIIKHMDDLTHNYNCRSQPLKPYYVYTCACYC